jgi:tripartite-type tricarboxylate transporter receptor subunit TctC
MNRIAAGLVWVAVVCIGLVSGAFAQDFPTRPITLVVPYPAGGGADIIGRLLAEHMKQHLGQPIAVTNKPGGQGTIGTAEVIHSKADGYTLVLSAVATLTVQPHRQELPYRTPDDYDPVIKVSNLPMVYAVLSKAPWKTAKDALEFIRANPGKIRVGTPGNGSIGHLIVASLNTKANVKFAHVPFASGAESIPALLGGHVESLVVHPSEILPHVQSKAVTILGAFEERRNSSFPEAPTFRELGYDITLGVYYPLVGPKNLPADVKAKLYRAAKASIESAPFSTRAKELGYVLDTKEPEAFRQELWNSFRANELLVKELGLGAK